MSKATELNKAMLEAEFADQTPRDLLLHIISEMRRINGAVGRHDVELYGDGDHGFDGLRARVEANEQFREYVQTRNKIIVAAASFVGAINLSTLGVFLLRLLT